VEQSGDALEYASAVLKSDKRFVFAAVVKNGGVLQGASAELVTELKNDKKKGCLQPWRRMGMR
jgi:hypothetical protein